MCNKKEHECAWSASRIRRTNKEKTKNQIKSLHYQILAEKTQSLFSFIIQTKQNRLKFWATTTTFERRLDVFFVKNRSFFLFERCHERTTRTSSKIERKLRIERKFWSDATLKRNWWIDFFLNTRKFAWRIERTA
jgi:hypothetical protein